MAIYLLSSSELEDRIEVILNGLDGQTSRQDVCDAVNVLVDRYNTSGDTGLLDSFIDSMRQPPEDYTLIDQVCSGFLEMVESCIAHRRIPVQLFYVPDESTIIVENRHRDQYRDHKTTCAQNDPVRMLKEAYHNACMQGDFFPERMRRVIDELETCV